MVPFDAVMPHLAGEEVTARDAGYPREVMEAGWVPEVAKLHRLRLGAGDADDAQAPTAGASAARKPA